MGTISVLLSIMHQSSGAGHRVWPRLCMLGSILHLLAADPLSCHPPLLSPQMCSELDILDTELLQFQQDSALPHVLGGNTLSLSLTLAECRAGAWVVGGD